MVTPERWDDLAPVVREARGAGALLVHGLAALARLLAWQTSLGTTLGDDQHVHLGRRGLVLRAERGVQRARSAPRYGFVVQSAWRRGSGRSGPQRCRCRASRGPATAFGDSLVGCLPRRKQQTDVTSGPSRRGAAVPCAHQQAARPPSAQPRCDALRRFPAGPRSKGCGQRVEAAGHCPVAVASAPFVLEDAPQPRVFGGGQRCCS